MIPNDLLGAATLLPWEMEAVDNARPASPYHQHRQLDSKTYALADEVAYCLSITGVEKPSESGKDQGGTKRFRQTESGSSIHSSSLESRPAVNTKRKMNGVDEPHETPNGGYTQSAKATVGDWRGAASVRFMDRWNDFLEHEDAHLDAQFDMVRDIHERLTERLGATRAGSTSAATTTRG